MHFLLYPSLSWLLLLCVNKFSYTSSCFPPLSWNKVKSQIIVSFSLCLWSKFDQKSIVSSIPFHQQYIHIRCNIRRKVVLNTWRKKFSFSQLIVSLFPLCLWLKEKFPPHFHSPPPWLLIKERVSPLFPEPEASTEGERGGERQRAPEKLRESRASRGRTKSTRANHLLWRELPYLSFRFRWCACDTVSVPVPPPHGSGGSALPGLNPGSLALMP